MDAARIGFDMFYDAIKKIVFKLTEKDPEKAHVLFSNACKTLYEKGLARFVLDNESNYEALSFTLANSAGFNKDAEIPPQVIRFLGFDRAVIGTVTGDAWQGNSKSEGYYGRQREIRFPKTESMVNWIGLQGEGAEIVAERLAGYKNKVIPITINLAPTPGKTGDSALRDLEKTVIFFRDITYVDRFELNLSCPNTPEQRNAYQRVNREMLSVLYENRGKQVVDEKISPDLSEKEAEAIVEIALEIPRGSAAGVRAMTTTNSTTNYDLKYIGESVNKGGASGNAVYEDSLKVHKLLYKMSKGTALRFNACGGINSKERILERLALGASEIQIFTPFIFSGPKFLREIKSYFS